MSITEVILNYIDGDWYESKGDCASADIVNPFNQDILGKFSFCQGPDVENAILSGARGFEGWKRLPIGERIGWVSKLKDKFVENYALIQRMICLEGGKTLSEARWELDRSISNLEYACNLARTNHGANQENYRIGVDLSLLYQPVGVCAVIAPFVFPLSVVMDVMPYALVTGNTLVIKPSPRTPMTMQLVFRMIHEIGFPKGVINLINGGNEPVDQLLYHPSIRAVSFSGTAQVAKYIYEMAASNGKRVQCQAKTNNFAVIMPDASVAQTAKDLVDLSFFCAGQSGLGSKILVFVGDARKKIKEAIIERSKKVVVGFGLDETTEMGALISKEDKKGIEESISRRKKGGEEIVVDGRNKIIDAFPQGNFICPTLIDKINIYTLAAEIELFGPVINLIDAGSLEEAISLTNMLGDGFYSGIYTNDGTAARKFHTETHSGIIGINLGSVSPSSGFSVGGWKESFLGDLAFQGSDAFQFFTQKKVIRERWMV